MGIGRSVKNYRKLVVCNIFQAVHQQFFFQWHIAMRISDIFFWFTNKYQTHFSSVSRQWLSYVTCISEECIRRWMWTLNSHISSVIYEYTVSNDQQKVKMDSHETPLTAKSVLLHRLTNHKETTTIHHPSAQTSLTASTSKYSTTKIKHTQKHKPVQNVFINKKYYWSSIGRVIHCYDT